MDAAFAVILASLGCGFLAARLGAMPNGAADTLNRFVVYVCLPALVLRLVPKLTWEPGLAVLAVAPWVLLFVGVALVLVVGRALRFFRISVGNHNKPVPAGRVPAKGSS